VKKVEVHIVGTRGNRKMELWDKQTKRVLATNFKSEDDAREYAEKKRWSVSSVSISERTAKMSRVSELKIAAELVKLAKGLMNSGQGN